MRIDGLTSVALGLVVVGSALAHDLYIMPESEASVSVERLRDASLRSNFQAYAKSLLSAGNPNGFYQTVTGQLIEIIPEKDPYGRKPGDSLPVRVLFRGSPAPKLQIDAAWAGPNGRAVHAVGRTDAGGRITVPLAQAGKWRLHTIRMERCSDPKAADWESFWASLTFELR